MNDLIYSDRYVGFLDILGFSEIVRRSQKPESRQAPALVIALGKAQSIAEGWSGGLASTMLKWNAFSDSIVISAEPSSNDLQLLLGMVEHLAQELLFNGLLARGGISRGALHHDDKVMFGPAFLDAYDLEHRVARVPRIVLSKSVYEDCLRFEEEWKDALLHTPVVLADDGPPFIDVLHSVFEPIDPSDRLENVKSLRSNIQNLVADSIFEPDHFAKTTWLAKQFNQRLAGDDLKDVEPIKFAGWDIAIWRRD
jgi:hypothetical protein